MRHGSQTPWWVSLCINYKIAWGISFNLHYSFFFPNLFERCGHLIMKIPFFILHACILDSNFLLIFNLFLPFKRGFSMVFFYHNKCRDGMLLCRIKNRYFPAISANLWDIKKRLSVDRENCFDLANCWVICNFTVTHCYMQPCSWCMTTTKTETCFLATYLLAKQKSSFKLDARLLQAWRFF